MKVLSILFLLLSTIFSTSATDTDRKQNIMKERIQLHMEASKAARGDRHIHGMNEIRKLIVGGMAANPTRFPYFTILDIETEAGDIMFCGAALAHEDLVVTIASCVEGNPSIFAAVNYTNDVTFTGFEQIREVTKVLIHPEFDPISRDFNLAGLRLESPVTGISPVMLSPRRTSDPGASTTATILGFGFTSENGMTPDLLQEAQVTVRAAGICVSAYENTQFSFRGPRNICAGDETTDTCDGDGGGPLIVLGATPAEDVLVGITSHGIGCARPGFPGVYARISFYFNFTEDAICELSSVRPISCPSLAPSGAPTESAAPTAPTASPAPSVSPAPSMAPTRGNGLSFCFSGETSVETEAGFARMDSLKLGDKIVVDDSGKLESVYGFGHFTHEKEAEYIQIITEAGGRSSPLELSHDHMVFVEGSHAVPASKLSIGDKVMLASGELSAVKMMRTVVREGAYAPFTYSGTVMVNGVKASSFVSFHESEYYMIGGYETPFTSHWLAHMTEAPHRMACRLGLCQTESYSEGGVSNWLYGAMKLHEWCLQQHPMFLVLVGIPGSFAFGVWVLEQFPWTMLLLAGLMGSMLALKSSVRLVKLKKM